MTRLAVTWWGHSSMTIEVGKVAVATDPLLSNRLFHLRRATPAPPLEAARADVVLVSHLHHDHLHVPSLERFGPDVPVVVPVGAVAVVPRLRRLSVLEVRPGDTLTVAGLDVEVLPAIHDGRRHRWSRGAAPALGFRFGDDTTSCWYPGDTGPGADLSGVAPVDLAAVPIGGWGPTLGEGHLHPEQAAEAVAEVGARWALAVHYGTLWPMALRRLDRRRYHHFFVTPSERFRLAVESAGLTALPLTPDHAVRLVLDAEVVPDSG